MKIVSWNCNGKFREKFKFIIQEDADIYIIQECENPNFFETIFDFFSYHYLWFGDNKNKGLAIFAKKNIILSNNNWECYSLRNFVSIKVNGKYDLIAVWAGKPYIEEYYIYQKIHINKYNENTILIGDFNSNAIWDKEHGKRNHTEVVKELEKINIVSAYHYFNREEMGKETKPTFYMYRHLDRPYHIDYCFANPNRLISFEIIKTNNMLELSDHLPIKVEIE